LRKKKKNLQIDKIIILRLSKIETINYKATFTHNSRFYIFGDKLAAHSKKKMVKK
jgi:hypothetical protein